MISAYSEREIIPLDIYLGSSLIVVSLALGINILIQSIWSRWLSFLLVLAGLLHATRMYDRENSLRGLWILGVLKGYPLSSHDLAHTHLCAAWIHSGFFIYALLYSPQVRLWSAALWLYRDQLALFFSNYPLNFL